MLQSVVDDDDTGAGDGSPRLDHEDVHRIRAELSQQQYEMLASVMGPADAEQLMLQQDAMQQQHHEALVRDGATEEEAIGTLHHEQQEVALEQRSMLQRGASPVQVQQMMIQRHQQVMRQHHDAVERDVSGVGTDDGKEADDAAAAMQYVDAAGDGAASPDASQQEAHQRHEGYSIDEPERRSHHVNMSITPKRGHGPHPHHHQPPPPHGSPPVARASDRRHVL